MKYLELNYLLTNNLDIITKINNISHFKKELELSLKYLRDNIKDKEIKKTVKLDLIKVKNKNNTILNHNNLSIKNILKILNNRLDYFK